MQTKTLFLTSVLLISALLVGCAGQAYARSSMPSVAAQQTPQPVNRTITVTGSSKVFLTPDIAYINIGVHTEGKNAAEAVALNNTQSAQVIEVLKKQGIAEKDIRTTNFSIYPQQQYDPQGKPIGEITYVVDNTVYVTVRKLEMVGALLDAAVKAGANSIQGIQFDVVDKTAALSQARKAAVADARAKADELAQAAGVTVVGVQSVSEYSSGYPVPMYDRGGGMVAVEAATVPIQPGQLTLTLEVNIVFEIQ